MAQTGIIEDFGGADRLKLVDRAVSDPGPGQVRIAHRACGLNFIDIYQPPGSIRCPRTSGSTKARP